MDIPDNIVDREILISGMEDTTGLYEIVWSLNTLYPSDDIAIKYAAADRRVRALLRAGHICLVRQFLRQGFRVESVREDEVEELLRSPIAWYPSDLSAESAQVAYETTPSGKLRYEEIYREITTVTQ